MMAVHQVNSEKYAAIDTARDLRNVLVAMSDMPKFYEKVFQYRFSEDAGAFAGHPLGNLIIAGLSEMQGRPIMPCSC